LDAGSFIVAALCALLLPLIAGVFIATLVVGAASEQRQEAVQERAQTQAKQAALGGPMALKAVSHLAAARRASRGSLAAVVPSVSVAKAAHAAKARNVQLMPSAADDGASHTASLTMAQRLFASPARGDHDGDGDNARFGASHALGRAMSIRRSRKP
jgi:Na+-transporting NADH:ubiquinone oxidoreductase subunit NqrC